MSGPAADGIERADVFHPAYCKAKNVMVLADTGDIGPEPRAEIPGNQLLAMFCAKDQMNMILRVAVSHGDLS